MTGAFVNNNFWEQWQTYFELRGFEVLIPVWPPKKGSVTYLRNLHPDPILGEFTLKELLHYYRLLIEKENEKPIAIGHSVGGLIVQLLLQENLLHMGVAIHSAPPWGVIGFNYSFFRSLWRPFGFSRIKISHI